jgi:hypothetical protein
MTRIRQVALVARQLAPVVEDLRAVLGIEVGYRDPGVGKYGLENVVMPVGDTFLEVVAPVTEGTTAGRYLERRDGDGGYMVIMQVDDIDATRKHVEDLGIRVVERIDRPGAWATQLHPKDVPGSFLSLDAMDPPEEWQWAGPTWREHVTPGVGGIVAAELQAADSRTLAARWAEVLQVPVATGEGGLELRFDGSLLRFVSAADGRGDGLAGIDVALADPEAALSRARERGLPVDGNMVPICGMRVRVV